MNKRFLAISIITILFTAIIIPVSGIKNNIDYNNDLNFDRKIEFFMK